MHENIPKEVEPLICELRELPYMEKDSSLWIKGVRGTIMNDVMLTLFF